MNEVVSAELGGGGGEGEGALRERFDYINGDMCTIGLDLDDDSSSALKAQSFDTAWISSDPSSTSPPTTTSSPASVRRPASFGKEEP